MDAENIAAHVAGGFTNPGADCFVVVTCNNKEIDYYRVKAAEDVSSTSPERLLKDLSQKLNIDMKKTIVSVYCELGGMNGYNLSL